MGGAKQEMGEHGDATKTQDDIKKLIDRVEVRSDLIAHPLEEFPQEMDFSRPVRPSVCHKLIGSEIRSCGSTMTSGLCTFEQEETENGVSL